MKNSELQKEVKQNSWDSTVPAGSLTDPKAMAAAFASLDGWKSNNVNTKDIPALRYGE